MQLGGNDRMSRTRSRLRSEFSLLEPDLPLSSLFLPSCPPTLSSISILRAIITYSTIRELVGYVHASVNIQSIADGNWAVHSVTSVAVNPIPIPHSPLVVHLDIALTRNELRQWRLSHKGGISLFPPLFHTIINNTILIIIITITKRRGI